MSNNGTFDENQLTIEKEPEFKNYKEKQAYYRDKYENRGRVIHVSKIIGREEKVLQPGRTYTSEKGEIRQLKKRARQERRSKNK